MSSTPLQPLPAGSGRGGNVSRNSRSARAKDSSSSHGLYPWLLTASTGLAAVFCYLYLTKPVIAVTSPVEPDAVETLAASPAEPEAVNEAPAEAPAGSLLPDPRALPGDDPSDSATAATIDARDPRSVSSGRSGPNLAYEETNLKVQHVLTAEADGVELGKIVLDVPVLYESRRLRWTPEDVHEARAVLIRLQVYREKMRNLKAEGDSLLDSWNRIMARSIPAEVVRADSPSLPANQGIARETGKAALETADTIQLQPTSDAE